MTVVPLQSIEALTDPGALSAFLGPIASIERTAFPTSGLSGAAHECITLIHPGGGRRRLILKTVVPARSWTAYRSGDTIGREALILAEPALQPIWDGVACPYLAYAVEPDRIGLLMDDLGPWLLPPGRRLSVEQEDGLLSSLAALHARFWQSDALSLSWLAPLSVRFAILGPGAGEQELRHHPDHPLFRAVARGWEIALVQVPPAVRRLLLLPAEEIAAQYAGLPHTLLHGDAKTGNCAFLPDRRVALFDWATPGPGPATLDLAYFLAVDVARHSRSKDAIIAAYRGHLASVLKHDIVDDQWERMQRIGALGAARMLLWSKALALERRDPDAAADWDWWVRALSL